MELTLKQKAFADYYIETGNAYQSAKKAGYSENYAKGNVVKLLENVSVKSYIDEQLKKIEDIRIAKAEEILIHLTQVMRGEIKEEVVVTEGTGEGCSDARIMEKQVSAKDRIKAAELLGKRYRLFTEKVELEGSVPVQIIDDIDD